MADNDDYMAAKAYDDTITELMWDRLQEGINANRRFRLRGVAGGNNMRYSSTKVVWDSDIYIYFTRESDGAWVYNKVNTNPTTGITCNDDDILYVTLNDTTGTVLTVSSADYTAMPTDDTGRILVLGSVRGSRWYGISTTDISHDSILNVSINDHHNRDHDNTEHSTNYEAANSNIQSHVGGTPPVDSHHTRYADSEVESVITAEIVGGQSIDNAIDSLILSHKNIAGAHHTKYVHPTTAGNKHIPSGGVTNNFLKYSASGTAIWATPSYDTLTDAISHAEQVKAGIAIHGGGVITVDASYRLGWTYRFICIAQGRGTHFSTAGFFNITQPTTGTITAVGGGTANVWNASGIIIPDWQSLYYVLPIGSDQTSLPANFRMVGYTADVEIPDHWVFIAGKNADSGNQHLKLSVGLILKASETWDHESSSMINTDHAQNHDNTYHTTNYAPEVGHSSIITVGTLSAGDVRARDSVGLIASKVSGDIFYWTTALQRLAKGTNSDVLTLVTGAPAWVAQGAPGAHDIITTHTDTGLATGNVIRASGPTTFAWAQLGHGDLSGIGSNAHSVIDTHLGAANPHSGSAATSHAMSTHSDISSYNISTTGTAQISGLTVTSTAGTLITISNSSSQRAGLTIYTVNDEPNELNFGVNSQFNRYSFSARNSVDDYDLIFYRNNGGWSSDLTWDWATGNFVFLNNITVTGEISTSQLTGTNIRTEVGSNISAIYDQDDMSSNSNSALATQQSIKAYVDLKQGAKVTINNKPAILMFADSYEDYPTTYDEDKAPFWKLNALTSATEDGNNYIKLDNVNIYGHDGMKLRWRSTANRIETYFTIPGDLPEGIVIKFKNFYYDDLGVADRFMIYLYAWVYDISIGKVVLRNVCQFIGEHNVYYHWAAGVKTNTGWGNPESLGYHDLTFFMLPQTSKFVPNDHRSPYRIECTGKTAVESHRDDVWDDDSDTFVAWAYGLISPSRSSGWDIQAFLRGIEIYARANHDI